MTLILRDDPETLPAVAGAYALLIDLREAAALPVRFGGTLPAGLYAYLGSARGPGGIRARCGRHFRRNKVRHWHVDWLTTGDARLSAAPFPDLTECDLVERLLEAELGDGAIPGFGSSDCVRCRSHLIALRTELPTVARALSPPGN